MNVQQEQLKLMYAKRRKELGLTGTLEEELAKANETVDIILTLAKYNNKISLSKNLRNAVIKGIKELYKYEQK